MLIFQRTLIFREHNLPTTRTFYSIFYIPYAHAFVREFVFIILHTVFLFLQSSSMKLSQLNFKYSESLCKGNSKNRNQQGKFEYANL